MQLHLENVVAFIHDFTKVRNILQIHEAVRIFKSTARADPLRVQAAPRLLRIQFGKNRGLLKTSTGRR